MLLSPLPSVTPVTTSEPTEQLRPRRRWGRLILWLVVLALIGVFVGLPIGSGYSTLQSLAPQDLGNFLRSILGYWQEAFGNPGSSTSNSPASAAKDQGAPAPVQQAPLTRSRELNRVTAANLIIAHPLYGKHWTYMKFQWDNNNNKIRLDNVIQAFQRLYQSGYIEGAQVTSNSFFEEMKITIKGQQFLQNYSKPALFFPPSLMLAVCTKAVTINGITQGFLDTMAAEYTWRCNQFTDVFNILKPLIGKDNVSAISFPRGFSPIGDKIINLLTQQDHHGTAVFKLYDDGWRLELAQDDEIDFSR